MTTKTLAEQETIYRWDCDERQVWGWTAHRAEASRWRALGYVVTDEPGGWRTRFPVEALALLPMKGGAVQTSRYLDPPIVLNAPSVRDVRTDSRITKQTRGCSRRALQTAARQGEGSLVARDTDAAADS